MRFLKLYAGIILILITVAVLAITFFGILDVDQEARNYIYEVCGLTTVLGVILCFVGGKMADKIGG